ncbi:alpha/beta hydrolase [Actinomycetospora lutea]|uniref:alpha/beta fold hydrolase n=1 Tax=Actinomycetospora lutea TaxID=663604 RepID=UPI0023666908|nr:alpha/beta fold hydrolase [Actinomycetospora lutea]MDD7937063.1 alpha/beta hydrolase [Actinomycetospora lutea]
MGEGPPLVLTTGALQGRASVRLLAEALADRFTVHLWDRRGRGDSGGVPDPARDPLGADGAAMVAAEIADLEAVVAATGGAPGHYAHSAGAVLVLEAVLRGLPATRVVAHEPPWPVDGDDAAPRRDLGAATLAALRADDPDDAAAAFLGGFPAAAPAPVERLRRTPFWAGTVALAPSLPHDVALVVGDPVPTDRLAALDVPLLALDGERSPAWVRRAVAALAASVPGAVHRTLPGQVHIVTPAVLAPVLADFLTG